VRLAQGFTVFFLRFGVEIGGCLLTAIQSKSLMGDLRTEFAQNQLEKWPKTLAAQAFSEFWLTHRICTK
jgi:hypothetical protein